MKKLYKSIVFRALILISSCLLSIATASEAPQKKTLDGEISDSQCGFNVHSVTRSHDEMIKAGYMGKTPEECTRNCVRGRGGQFVFVTDDKKHTYRIEPQDMVKDFAGKKVQIQGTLADEKFHVTGIKPL
ncbi:MAG TPA: DUF5818 domain-containing protein [Candidatus Angelobacter sp.]|nr:DUF5818 domain-containing protein [Candidatus Angelobacter sp.]